MIFVTAISEFDQVLYEDEKCNRLVESMNVFEEICNEPSFDTTAMIVFLNKVDSQQARILKFSCIFTMFVSRWTYFEKS